MLKPLKLDNLHLAEFVFRPNRFIVKCKLINKKTVTAYLPNPGRLWELFLPKAVLYLTHSDDPERKHKYTVMAVEKDGHPILLHTHFTNDVAEFLLRKKKIKDLEDATIVRREVKRGKSRFDFLLKQGNKDVYLEVKSCTLFAERVAMFPDAITERGKRHLLELSEIKGKNEKGMVLIVCHYPEVDWFMPDYHTDLEFAKAFLSVRKKLEIIPIGISWNKKLELSPKIKQLEIPWKHLAKEVDDCGAYFVVLKLSKAKEIEVGSLGLQKFKKGYYVYVGSAMQNLEARINRHKKAEKKLHWHIDYLRKHCEKVWCLPIRSSQKEECLLADNISKKFEIACDDFGSSDCDCPAHLFYSKNSPLENQHFFDLLFKHRMKLDNLKTD